MSKVDEAEVNLLDNLFNLLQTKHKEYSFKQLEEKFGAAARSLVSISEISEESLIFFCNREGIDVPAKKSVSSSSSKSSSSYGGSFSDPCGRSSYRSGC